MAMVEYTITTTLPPGKTALTICSFTRCCGTIPPSRQSCAHGQVAAWRAGEKATSCRVSQNRVRCWKRTTPAVVSSSLARSLLQLVTFTVPSCQVRSHQLCFLASFTQQPLPTEPLHVCRLRVECAPRVAHAPQPPPKSNVLRQRDVMVEANPRCVQLRR